MRVVDEDWWNCSLLVTTEFAALDSCRAGTGGVRPDLSSNHYCLHVGAQVVIAGLGRLRTKPELSCGYLLDCMIHLTETLDFGILKIGPDLISAPIWPNASTAGRQ
jgi:hypothetical protein